MERKAPVDSPTIKPINKGVVHRICSGQVILDLSSAVKELVENSLDAGATTIEIALKDYGQESIKVIDNGYGISPTNFKVLALKHHTSKIADFPDLQSLTTFGFRGEALSSLCALGNLTVETRTKNEPIATQLTFDHSGLLTCEKKMARQIGTTITVEKLFSTLPVRSKEFSRNIRREYGKLISLLNAYALIAKGVRLVCTNTTGKNMKSVVLNTQGSSSIKDNIITVFGMNTFTCLEPLTICISDSCTVEGFLSKPGQGSGRNLGDRQYFFVNGRPVDMPKVSKIVNELYKTSNSRQYPIMIMNFTVPTRSYDVNVTPDKRKIFFSDEGSLVRSLRESIENIYSPSHCSYPANKLEEPKNEPKSFELPHAEPKRSLKRLSTEGCDHKEAVCSEEQIGEDDSSPKTVKKCIPDLYGAERMVHNKKEKTIGKDFTLRAHALQSIHISPQSHTKPLRTPIPSDASDKCDPSTPLRAVEKDVIGNLHSSNRSSSVQSSLTNFITVNKRKLENSCTLLSELPVLRNEAARCQVRKTNSEMQPAISRSFDDHHHVDHSPKVNENETSKCCTAIHLSSEVETSVSGEGNLNFDGSKEQVLEHQKKPFPRDVVDADSLPGKDPEVLDNISEDLSGTTPVSTNVMVDAPVPSSGLETCSILQFSIKDLRASRERRRSILQSSHERKKIKRCFAAATLELSQPDNEERKARALAAATMELERFFNKRDFGRMKVIGQFNLGFIIGRLDQDLFIIDQHAADEKYNFERLSQTTILNQQPLLQPIRLELSPEEEVIASMHMDIIRKNGFTLVEDISAPSGHHFKLRAVPFSKNITFGAEDVKELISTLGDSQGDCSIVSSYRFDTPDSVCPSRVRAMFASRACRSSVMIGDALGNNEMKKILEHLADLKSPWNCPHGRPTMRHLVDLTTIYNNQDLDDPDL